jgi:uncharacterized protein
VLLLTPGGAIEYTAVMARKKVYKEKLQQQPTLNPHMTPNLNMLLERAHTGDSAQAVEACILARGSIDAATHRGEALLLQNVPLLHHMAFKNAHPHNELAESVKLLVAAGADINAIAGPEHDICTAIMLSCTRSCCTTVLQVFLQHGADVLIPRANGLTTLHIAAAAGCSDSCKLLLAKASSLLHMKNAQGYTALMYTVKCSGSVDTIKMLHQHGADINTTDVQGATPLMLASAHKQVDMAGYLLKAGANVNAVDDNCITALATAVVANSVPIVQLLLNGADISITDSSGQNALFKAVAEGHIFMMDMLVKRGLSITAVDNKRNTLLVIAAYSGQTAAVEWLLQHGVGVNAANNTDGTALHAASASSKCNANTSVINLLLAHGADVNIRNQHGNTALGLAVFCGNIQHVRALIDGGADVNQHDSRGVPCLHMAVTRHHSTVAQLLLEHGATAVMNGVLPMECSHFIDGYSCCCRGITSLMLCTDVDTMKVLLAAGADVHVTTDTGDTCLHLAARHKLSVPLICLLIKAGADLHALNNDGKTAAQIAHDLDNILIGQILVRAAQQLHG